MQMSSKHEMYLVRALGFVLICTVTFLAGATARELVWTLYMNPGNQYTRSCVPTSTRMISFLRIIR
jgi:hypothetical protein